LLANLQPILANLASDRLSSLLEDIAERMCLNHGGLFGLEEAG